MCGAALSTKTMLTDDLWTHTNSHLKGKYIFIRFELAYICILAEDKGPTFNANPATVTANVMLASMLPLLFNDILPNELF